MKNFLRIFTLAVCGFAGTTFADDFKSVVVPETGSVGPIRVHGDQFMVIRNFTQEGTASNPRGVVTVTISGGTMTDVLTAAIVDPTTAPEVINNVVIAGPANVTVTCGAPAGMNCFISYKKDSN
jgi:hypothetical protein